MLNEQMNIVKSSPFFQKAVKGKGGNSMEERKRKGQGEMKVFSGSVKRLSWRR